MKTRKQTICGSWSSPVNSQLTVTAAVSLDAIQLDGDTLYYLERRPQQQGRCVIVQCRDGKTDDILPPPYSARSRVHEYGGGVYCFHHDSIYFVNDKDQAVYCICSQQIQRVTNSDTLRFADLIFDRTHNRLIAVAENHLPALAGEQLEAINSLVAIDINNGEIIPLCAGFDFYASPRISPNGKQICWLSWNHPNMPWDGTELWLADMATSGALQHPMKIAGFQSTSLAGKANISICQPGWSPDNQLFFISDEKGWWQLYRYEANGMQTLITPEEQDFGLPHWVFAQSSYAFISATQILTHASINNQSSLVIINPFSREKTIITSHWQIFSSIVANTLQFAFIGASSIQVPQVIACSLPDKATIKLPAQLKFTPIKTSAQLAISNDYFPRIKIIIFKNRHQQKVYANYYPPTNPLYTVNTAERPPLIVICHGGPTGSADTALDPRKLYWTSRGFALLDVNYSGSTGYGRDYRRRLNGQWGLLDVEDCCDAALYAVKKGLADKNHLIIRGSSAGGYTVLCALTFHSVFSAGASYYGISELESLATDTHKFESRYLDRLIGPYPETKKIYQQRSPLYHNDQLNCPVIFFQGIDDKIVPKEQAEKMIAALDKKGIAVASRFFTGEQHGFRKAETITATLDNELYFYSRLFGFETEDGVPLEIKNL